MSLRRKARIYHFLFITGVVLAIVYLAMWLLSPITALKVGPPR